MTQPKNTSTPLSSSIRIKDVKKAKLSTGADGESTNPLCCPKCQKLLAGVGAVRLQSRPRLTPHMQKLLRRKRENENGLTPRQHQLLQREMQRCNVLVMKCRPCQWEMKVQLHSREVVHRHKARIRTKVEQEQQSELMDTTEGNTPATDKMAQKKMRKKEKRKKTAQAKAQDLLGLKRLSMSPINGVAGRGNATPLCSTPFPSQSSVPSPAPHSSSSNKPQPGPVKSATFVTPSPFSSTKAASKSDSLTPQSDRALFSRPTPGRNKRGSRTAGKEQLRKVLNQQKKGGNLSASESLSQFLNSLK